MRALITGVSGQDGSFLSDFLISKEYEVHGLVRRTSSINRNRTDHIYSNKCVYNNTFHLHYCDLDDVNSLRRIIIKYDFDEIYHLASQSHVGLSNKIPESTCKTNCFGTLSLLEILRDCNPKVKFFNASSSEIFGNARESPQTEETAINPITVYGVTKAFATQLSRIYRDSYNLNIYNGIMYGHESPRRGENFLTKKICQEVVKIKYGLAKKLEIGPIHERRDWGHALDYVRGMWLMMQNDPDDYILATGKSHSVADVLDIAFSHLNMHYQDYITINKSLNRGYSLSSLIGDASKARKKLHWENTITFEEMIIEMVDYELKKLNNQ